MTSTTTLTGPTTRDAQPAGVRPRVWRVGAVASIAASVATFAFAAAADAMDVPLAVGGKTIPPVGFAQLTLVASVIGTILATVLTRTATRPRRTFLVTTIALTLASFVPDVLADATTATKVVLVLSHVIAAAIVIPALASRLTD